MPNFKIAKCISHQNPASKFHELVFETEVPFTFQPGQYISVLVAPERINSYSIASGVGPNRFLLLVDISPGGVGSKYFENLKVGDEIKYLGPLGNFLWKDDAGISKIFFIATGCGISPLRAMIENALRINKTKIPIRLYFGLRFKEDIFWESVFNQLNKEFPNFSFGICLSKPDESWQGAKGHVTDIVAKDLTDASGVACYISGNQQMISEMTQILTSRGGAKERIYFENFHQSETKNTTDVFSVKIGGQAGQGIKTAGEILSKTAVSLGYETYNYCEYPSLIRGGHNVIQVGISANKIGYALKQANLLVALDQKTIDLHKEEMTERSGVIYDRDSGLDVSALATGCQMIPVPLTKLATDTGGGEIVRNSVALGVVVAVLNGPIENLEKVFRENYQELGEEVVKQNLVGARAGYDFAKSNFSEGMGQILIKREGGVNKILICGNKAVALGAVAAGLQFASIYPMSPISDVLKYLALWQEKSGYIYKQPEDEIAAINMTIGAAWAGARAMTATSGGGFCLMSEGLGLAGMTETPLVIIEGMRPGPATGLPTWSGQGDLRFILQAHQDEFPRIVIAPGDAEETFFATMDAFNLAEKYQTPVVILIDKCICDNEESFSEFNTSTYQIDRGKLVLDKQENLKRYEITADGISPRSIPGRGNYFVANSDEHDVMGFSSETITDRVNQMDKRMKKLVTCAENDMPVPQVYGPEKADVTIVSWGSNKGTILAAIKNFSNVNFLHLTWINPFPDKFVAEFLGKAKQIIDIEGNWTGQMAGYIREKTGVEIREKLLKYDGRPFFPEEIREKITSVLGTKK